MKKLITIFMSLILIFTVAACAKKDTSAKHAVGEALMAVKKTDFITARKYFDLDQVLESDFLSGLDINVEHLSLISIDKAKLFLKNLSYEVISANEEPDKAVIEVAISNTDMGLLFNEYSKYSSELLEKETNGILIKEKLAAKLTELLSDHNLEMKTSIVTVNVHKTKGKWKIDVDKELVDAVLGGLMN